MATKEKTTATTETKAQKTPEQIEAEKAERAAKKKEAAEKKKEDAKAEKDRAAQAKKEAKEADEKAKADAKAKKDAEKAEKEAAKQKAKEEKEAKAKEKAESSAEKSKEAREAKKAEKDRLEAIEKMKAEKQSLLDRAEEIRQFIATAENEGGKLTTAIRCKGKQRVSITLPLDPKVLLEAAIVDLEQAAAKIFIPTPDAMEVVQKSAAKDKNKKEQDQEQEVSNQEEPTDKDIEEMNDFEGGEFTNETEEHLPFYEEGEEPADEDYAFQSRQYLDLE